MYTETFKVIVSISLMTALEILNVLSLLAVNYNAILNKTPKWHDKCWENEAESNENKRVHPPNARI